MFEQALKRIQHVSMSYGISELKYGWKSLKHSWKGFKQVEISEMLKIESV